VAKKEGRTGDPGELERQHVHVKAVMPSWEWKKVRKLFKGGGRSRVKLRQGNA